ncbi:beta-ketoacyl synthase [Candidatus Scalindua japonica]|uniref:Beta-ketoacyl synthase n=1 Tax=Candidatus Scalindua japonica TaxID=1284222 RepID=A0A286TUY7_9BACT|nr:type I polyketide synthase [Candidatus Scalindua japonica]GAX59674.1 beta-ketoacyl synthase [Candidatus Scalindua japonica]
MIKERKINEEPIAIVGMACTFPQAPDLETFWCNILAGVDVISEPLPDWEAERYLGSGRINTSYGGFLKDLYRFDPKEFGIMPNSVDGGEPDQFLALRIARDALQDAGCLGCDFDHRDTGIIIGHSTYLHRGQGNLIQHNIVLDQTVELIKAVCPSVDYYKLSEIRKLMEKKLPQFNADIVPGLVPNVMTGRIANRLNLKGPNYLIDAACSSSLLAVSAAVDELRNGRSRMMLAGGVNASLPAEVAVIFTQLGAMSKRGKLRPFEEGSDGTLLGEGLGIIALKRVSDAIADNNRIYSVIRNIGQASDGQGFGLLTPSVDGEALSIERAYSASEIAPETIELIEAHGTGIPLGDKTEISALKKIFGERKGVQGSIAIGSIKSMIGHCIPAAGIAGLIKSALALHHKILPPTLCDSVNPVLSIENTPFYVNTATKPWISRIGGVRRSGINSFGFGGINAHAILEEAPEKAMKPLKLSAWPAELCIFSAENVDELIAKLKKVASFLKRNSGCKISDIAATLVDNEIKCQHRLALVVKNADDFVKKINQALKRLQNNTRVSWSTRNGINYSSKLLNGKLAFMFPGEGSQYLGMFTDLALHFEEVREWFGFWRGLYNDVPGETRTDIVFPPQSELTELHRKNLEKKLYDMDVGSEAVFVAGQAMYTLLKSFGVQPDVMVGHSTGESSALVSSGAMDSKDLVQLAGFIRELNAIYKNVLAEGKIPTGALLAVGALPQSTVEKHIAAVNNEVMIAMDNCMNQLVLYGSKESIKALQKKLCVAGGICVALPFDRGYHTSKFSDISKAFFDYYERIGLEPPAIPLYSCSTADLFPEDQQGVRKLAAGQWSKKVRFRETVTKMYSDGVRYFIEVGPSGNLSSFVNDILAKGEYISVATNQRQKNDLEQFLILLSLLYVNGKELNLEKLFNSRLCNVVELEGSVQSKQPGILLKNTMPVMHISNTDRAALQEILKHKESTNNESKKTNGSLGNYTQIPKIDSLDSPKGVDQVMSSYFDLMHDFLDKQQTVAELCGSYEGSVTEDVNSISEYTPFLTSIIDIDEHCLQAECYLSIYEDNFLRDHIMSGTVSKYDEERYGLSCVPLMVSLEIMAEASALLVDSTAVKAIEDVKAFDWIALDDGELTLNVRAEVIDSGSNKIQASIINAGTVAVSAIFYFDTDWCLGGVPLTTEWRDSHWEGHELYTIGMFHGPTFQSIRRVDWWNDNGIEASLSEVSLDGFFKKNETPGMVLNPVLLDALGQLAAYWIAHQVGTDFNSFPSTIERIELYVQCPQNINDLKLRAHQQPLNPIANNMEEPRVWQFECIDKQGQPLLRVKNLVNIYFPVPNRFYEFRRDPLNGWLGHLSKVTEYSDIILWQIPHFSEKFCLQSGGIFLRILAHALLSSDELNEWRQLTKNIRHRREWLLGRACIKEAVRFWFFQQTGQLLYPSDIIVLHDEKGAPHVDGEWCDDLVQLPEVSLSHDRRLSLAAVSQLQNSVGIDIEHIGRIQHPELIEGSLSEKERKLLRSVDRNTLEEKMLRMWCAKEAASKYLGLGLQGMPEKFEVLFFHDDWNLAHVRYNGTVVEVNVSCDNDSVVALATRQIK